ncbi:hypothetical protein [Candidatus Leptofilum sp.]|uniref:hypothetical protein n=1 Tax=Candidatus Leptofilum sp. TaxID=3241576 RepID=UPI003B5C53F8
MRKRSCSQQLGLLILLGSLLFGGLIIGLPTAALLAPNSQIAPVLGFFMLPTALVLALLGWYGTAVAATTFGAAKKTVQTGSLTAGLEAANQQSSSPPGKIVLLLIPAFIGTLFGLVLSVVAGESFLGVTAVCLTIGFGYGLVLYLAARFWILSDLFAALFDDYA